MHNPSICDNSSTPNPIPATEWNAAAASSFCCRRTSFLKASKKPIPFVKITSLARPVLDPCHPSRLHMQNGFLPLLPLPLSLGFIKGSRMEKTKASRSFWCTQGKRDGGPMPEGLHSARTEEI